MNDFADLDEKSPEQLGLEGYCFIAARLLSKLHPSARIYRLFDEESDYAHVFLRVKGQPLDIMGFRSVKDMIAGFGSSRMAEGETSIDEVWLYFCKITDRDEREYVAVKLKEHIDANEQKYTESVDSTSSNDVAI